MEAVEEIDKTRYNIVMKNLTIGNVKLNGNVLLAPMAGFTSLPFRRLALEFGASLTFTEMVSAKACLFDNKKTMEILDVHESEKPCACQIFGSEPDVMSEAVKLPVFEKFDIIDINMGCPAPKIVQNGEGSALLNDINRARDIIKAVVNSTNKPVTVKFRIGFTPDKIIAVEFAKMCEEAGAKAITIHGRTTTQGYSGKADMEIIKLCKQSVSIPVIANGDCTSKEDYDRILNQTGADGVMIGRGALGNPQVFSEIKSIKNNKSRKDVILTYLDYMNEYFSGKKAVLESRAHIMFFLRGLKNSTQIKTKIMKVDTISELKSIIIDFFNNIDSKN